MAYTKGPWTFNVDEEFPMSIRQMDGSEYIIDGCGCCGSPNLDRASAHLISAAPELLEALEGMVRMSELNGTDDRVIHELSLRAIRKAKGEA